MRSIFLLLAACAGEPELPATLDGCGDTACRESWVRTHAAAQPREVARAIADHAEPVEQLALLELLLEQAPPGTPGLCRPFQRGEVRQRCQTVANRPHLREQKGSPLSGEPEARGPRQEPRRGVLMAQVGKRGLAPTLTDIPATTDDRCPSGSAGRACWTEAAAAADTPREAAAHCKALSEVFWQDECLFQAAEKRFDPEARPRPDVAQVADAVELCLASRAFQAQCLSHTATGIALGVSPGHQPDPEAWTWVTDATTAAHTALAPIDPEVAELFDQRVWSKASWTNQSTTGATSGAGFDGAPDAALPFLRGAAAHALLQAGEPGDLPTLVARLEALEADRSPGAARAPIEEPQLDLWPTDLDGEDDLPTVLFGNRLRRTRGTTADLDRAISVLEAAAQVRPPRPELLQAALDHDDPRVRWTATRLLRCTEPELDLSRLADDPDPLVAQRATQPCPTAPTAGPGKVGKRPR